VNNCHNNACWAVRAEWGAEAEPAERAGQQSSAFVHRDRSINLEKDQTCTAGA
jgi:hypothetical protein